MSSVIRVDTIQNTSGTSEIKIDTIKDTGGNSILSSDGSGTFTTNFSTGISKYFLIHRSGDFSFNTGAWTKVQWNSVQQNTGMTWDSSNYRLTPGATGIYQFINQEVTSVTLKTSFSPPVSSYWLIYMLCENN